MGKTLVANWKMNPQSEREAIKLAKISDKENVVICAPFLFLLPIKKILKKAKLGAQDCSFESKGAFTGQISPTQLKKIGASYVILGHSERRIYLGETNETVAKKLRAALDAKLIPIVCVGETKSEHERSETEAVLSRQLGAIEEVLNAVPGNIFIAYEPIWSISTFKTDKIITPAEAQVAISFIKNRTSRFHERLQFLYGGSVTDKNLLNFIEPEFISGALVGSASISATIFSKMIRINHSNE